MAVLVFVKMNDMWSDRLCHFRMCKPENFFLLITIILQIREAVWETELLMIAVHRRPLLLPRAFSSSGIESFCVLLSSLLINSQFLLKPLN